MDKQTVIKYFGSKAKTGRALGLSRQAVGQWPDPIPYLRAHQIQVVTKGRLKVDETIYECEQP